MEFKSNLDEIKKIPCYSFNFPLDTYHQYPTYLEVAKHLATEVVELSAELEYGPVQDCIMECMDVIHVAESLLYRWLEEGEDLDSYRERVIAKNEARGYYN